MRRTSRACGAAALVLVALAAAATACTAIVGVQDVRLRKDASDDDADELPPDDASIDVTPLPDNPLEVALGGAHTCARKPEGPVKCWGDDSNGQTGTGGPAGDGGFVSAPQDVSGITDAVDVSAGLNHTCVARKSGTVSCWGYNLDGQLGNGESGNRLGTPVDVKLLNDATNVAAGSNFTCALRVGGSVACWGGNLSGQLGLGKADQGRNTPALVTLGPARSLAAGEAHACAALFDGSVFCWGDGPLGQLGGGTAGSTPAPIKVTSLDLAVSVVAGQRSTCALRSNGTVFCWGANDRGQLGRNTTNDGANAVPSAVVGLSDAVAIAAGANHACAVRRSGTVVCWGAGGSGQLGDGTKRDDGGVAASPVNVSGIQTAIGVGAGGAHSCAPTRTGAILCWGADGRSQLGDKQTTNQFSPVSVAGYP